MSGTAIFPIRPDEQVQEVETFSKPGVSDVTPSDLKKISPIVKHYAKMAHPFTACYRDQIKHGLTSDHAKRRCSVIKTLGGRNAANVVKEQIVEEMGWTVERFDGFLEETRTALHVLSTQLPAEIVVEAATQGYAFMALPADRADAGPASLLEVDLSQKGREKMAKAKTAMSDGSFPIPNVEFLKKAISAFGRAKNKDAAKAWIKKRAKALHATNLLPSNWKMAERECALIEEAEQAAAVIEMFGWVPEKLGEAASPPSWMLPPAARRSGFQPYDPEKKSKSKSSSSSSNSEFDSKHPRAKGGATGGQFIRKGASNQAVKGVQSKLGIKTTGTFDASTKKRVEQFQRKHGLVVDGIVGAQTASALLGKSAQKPGVMSTGLRHQLKKLGASGKLKEGDLEERTVHVETREDEPGVKIATVSKIRSALYDLSEPRNPTHTVQLPKGTKITVKAGVPPRTYSSFNRTFVITSADGETRREVVGTDEAAEVAKEIDAGLLRAAKPGAVA